MSELRRDPITREWVLLSAEAAYHPQPVPKVSLGVEVCPFCPGREALTPPEITANRPSTTAPNTPGWRLRVIPNRVPLLRIEEGSAQHREELFQSASGVGAHEVIIESAEHKDWWDFSPQELWEVLLCWRERLIDLRRDERLRHAVIIRRASLHPHSQIIALPFWAPTLRRELHGARRYFEEHHRCAFCDLLHEEARREVRVVLASEEVMAITPYASRQPFTLRVFLRHHLASFEATTPQALLSFATTLRDAMQRLGRALDRPPYLLALHSAPYAEANSASFHWYLEILPTLSPAHGLEAAFGCAVNPTAPETAAAFLREVIL